VTLVGRGIFWLALYVLLVVTPLAVAVLADPFPAPRPALVEVSVAVGLVAYSLVLIQFALVSHLQASSRPFGTDALVQFHRYIGFAALAFIIGHPILLNITGLPWSAWAPLSSSRVTSSGAVALYAIVALVFTTVLRRRLRLSYEVWRTIHLAMSITAVAAMLVHVLAADGYGRSASMRVVLLGYILTFGAMVATYRVLRPLRMRSRSWEVVENRDEGARTRTIRVRPINHAGFVFDPGQFAWLITGASPFSQQQHPLSICSSAERPADGPIEFAVRALGDWSANVVPGLTPGTRVWVDGAFGAFTTEGRAAQGFVLIAGGIGIAPMRSMLLTMRDRGDRRHVILMYASHAAARPIFWQELEALRADINLDSVDALASSPADPTSGHRRFTVDVLRRHLPPHFQRYHYFVCGPAPMMDTVEASLAALGVLPGAIHSERFHVV
jgi:predicted ferric reductase